MFLDEPILSKSGRISLVPPSESDDPAVAILRSAPETRRYLRFLPENLPVAAVAARRVSRSTDPSLVDFHIHTSPAGALVGSTGIFNIDTHYGNGCEVGILVLPEHARSGVATDALYTVLEYVFETRGMNRAEFQTGADNAPMRGWLERTGARLEGVRKSVWKDPATGGYSDVCLYGLIKEEWEGGVKESLEKRIFSWSPTVEIM
ncbi:Ribosomal-protein-alanine acetyltransferase [Mycena kentingensis (nom. inval.)]|nr:Ribosomal-protein-alanine acetyltransferase [Mycena kentingensis (nom. inval.)]